MRNLKLVLASLERHRKTKLNCPRVQGGLHLEFQLSTWATIINFISATSCNFTKNHYFNPEFSFSPTVGFVQICCFWEWSCCDMENTVFLLFSRAEWERNGFDVSLLQT